MTLKEFLLDLPENKVYQLDYYFSCFCPECRKYVNSLDEEYSSSGTGATFRHDVNTSQEPGSLHDSNHYRGYSWIYEDFDTDTAGVNIEDTADGVKISIYMDGDEEICEACMEKLDNAAN